MQLFTVKELYDYLVDDEWKSEEERMRFGSKKNRMHSFVAYSLRQSEVSGTSSAWVDEETSH